MKYIVRFLRHIIDSLETQSLDIHDDLYITLCNAQTHSESEYSFKHYKIWCEGSVENVILKENENKISQGTTGLHAWESSIILSEWSIQNKAIFYNKNILELGAGTGLSSLIISKCCSPKTVTITDGNDKVLEILTENVSNNFDKDENCKYRHTSSGATIGNDLIQEKKSNININ